MRLDPAHIARIADDLRALLGDDYDDQTFLDTLDGETDALEIAERLIAAMREAEAMSAAAKAQADALAARASRFAAAGAAHKAQLGPLLDAIGTRKLVLPAATVSRLAGRASVRIDAPDDVPTQLCRIRREPDKAAIKAALEAGEAVPGARLENGPDTVSVRVA
jgi:hypothetical protein